jgi:hypothetical protein
LSAVGEGEFGVSAGSGFIVALSVFGLELFMQIIAVTQ